MTTTVTIHVQGNKAVEVQTNGAPASTIYPGQTVTRMIHGDVSLTAKETGDFLPAGSLEWVKTPVPITNADAAADLAGTPRPDHPSA